jgi:hypothetical protein
MSGNLAGFDANNVQPNSFDVLPAGEYDAVIVSSVVEPTSKGDGKFLKLELQVLNGEYQNRKLTSRLNLWNPSAKAQEIARGELSSICRAVGVLTPNDSSDLHNKPLRVKVIVRKSDEYGDQNEIKAYKPRNAGPGPAAPGGNGKPWPASPPAAPLSPGQAAYQETVRQAASVF